jgi:hypothetical protein
MPNERRQAEPNQARAVVQGLHAIFARGTRQDRAMGTYESHPQSWGTRCASSCGRVLRPPTLAATPDKVGHHGQGAVNIRARGRGPEPLGASVVVRAERAA